MIDKITASFAHLILLISPFAAALLFNYYMLLHNRQDVIILIGTMTTTGLGIAAGRHLSKHVGAK
jgi:hypothetical protein